MWVFPKPTIRINNPPFTPMLLHLNKIKIRPVMQSYGPNFDRFALKYNKFMKNRQFKLMQLYLFKAIK